MLWLLFPPCMPRQIVGREGCIDSSIGTCHSGQPYPESVGVPGNNNLKKKGSDESYSTDSANDMFKEII